MDSSFFEVVMYLAFEVMLAYDDKKSLTVSQLRNYRLNILKQINNYFSQGSNNELTGELKDYLKKNKEIDVLEEVARLVKFVEENNNLFYLKDGIIYLKEDVTALELEKIRYRLTRGLGGTDTTIYNLIQGYSGSLDSLEILGAEKVKNDIFKLFKFEEAVEESYQNYQDDYFKNCIRVGQFLIAGKLRSIFKQSYYYISKYYMLLGRIVNGSRKDIKTQIISNKLREHHKFYRDHSYVEYMFQNRFQKAIFSDESLAWDKCCEYLNVLETLKRTVEDREFLRSSDSDYEDEYEDEEIFEQEEDEEIDYLDEDEYDEEDDYYYEETDFKILKRETKSKFIFYLKYLELIDEYSSKFDSDESLLKAKTRLLYLFDRYEYGLYDKEGVERLNDNISLDDLSDDESEYKEYFYEFYVMSTIFLLDILCEKNEEFLLKKILFISAYYEITKDERVEELIDKYRTTDIGTKVYQAVINHNKDVFKSSNCLVKIKEIKEKNRNVL